MRIFLEMSIDRLSPQGVLVYEAILRIIHPGEHIHGDWMTGIAAIGLVISTELCLRRVFAT